MTQTARPNILLIVVDSLSAADLVGYANRLPNISALANEGMRFEKAFASSPEGGPARASLFTGLDMAAHGVWTDGVALPPHEITLGEHFARSGYHTWLVGRRQLAGASHWTTEHARAGEFHHFHWAHGPLHRSRQNAYLTWLKSIEPDVYHDIFPIQPFADDTIIPKEQRAKIAALPDALSFHHWMAEQTLERLTLSPKGRPFFGIVGCVIGDKMGAPDGSGIQIDAVHDGALQQADKAIGTIVTAARTIPDTQVIITSARGSKSEIQQGALHQNCLHVPLIFLDANLQSPNLSAPVSTMDLAPTLYEISDLTPPPRLQGTSLVNQVPRNWTMSRLRHPDAAHQTSLILDNWKLVMTHDRAVQQPFALFDLDKDSNETHDLSNDPAFEHRLEEMIDVMIDARVALEDRTEPRIAMF